MRSAPASHRAGPPVQTVSGFAKAIVDAADRPSAPEDLTDSEYWKDVLLRAGELCERRWDTVVVDEAQDLQEEAWLLVQELAAERRLWAFHDPGQSFWPTRHPPAHLFGTTSKLPRGKRCPEGVEALAARLAGGAAAEQAISDAKDLSNLQTRMYVALTRALVCARLVGTKEQLGRYGR